MCQLTGKKVGDEIAASIPPQEGYGVRDPAVVQEVPRDAFPPDAEAVPGAEFVMQDDGGQEVQIWIVQVDDGTVTIDANHFPKWFSQRLCPWQWRNNDP